MGQGTNQVRATKTTKKAALNKHGQRVLRTVLHVATTMLSQICPHPHEQHCSKTQPDTIPIEL